MQTAEAGEAAAFDQPLLSGWTGDQIAALGREARGVAVVR
jgi:hypothetical protein